MRFSGIARPGGVALDELSLPTKNPEDPFPLVLSDMSLLYVRSRVVPLADKLAHLGLVFICELFRSGVIVAEIGNKLFNFTMCDLIAKANKRNWVVAAEVFSGLKQGIDRQP